MRRASEGDKILIQLAYKAKLEDKLTIMDDPVLESSGNFHVGYAAEASDSSLSLPPLAAAASFTGSLHESISR
jgi:hypothetical protein